MHSARFNSSNGFSLIEVMIAMVVLTIVSLGVAQMFGYSVGTNMAARSQTSTATLAMQKMEQLRGLTWGYDTDTSNLGLPVSDTTSDLSTQSPSTGGPGLNPSPAGTLDKNTQYYCDFLDQSGSWVANGTTAPAGSVYIRRWSVEPLPTNPNNTLVLQVLVTTVAAESGGTPASPRPRLPGDGWVLSVKTRKSI
jgi:prepilin-type N-terminal cleavage/methylation domain-containing protein